MSKWFSKDFEFGIRALLLSISTATFTPQVQAFCYCKAEATDDLPTPG